MVVVLHSLLPLPAVSDMRGPQGPGMLGTAEDDESRWKKAAQDEVANTVCPTALCGVEWCGVVFVIGCLLR